MAGAEKQPQNTLSVLESFLDDGTSDKFRKELPKPASTNPVKVDVQSLLSFVEDILGEATATVYSVAKGTHTKFAHSQGKISSTLMQSCVPLSSTINEVCCQITCEALHTTDVHEIMKSLFSKLSSYSWDAKAVVTLLAFSVFYAENWRLAQTEESDKLLSLVSMLKGFRSLRKASDRQRVDDFMTLNSLINWTLEITKRTVAYQTNRNYLKECKIDLEANFFYVILTVLDCSIQFSGMINMSAKRPKQDLSSFANRVHEKFEPLNENVEKNEQTIFLDLKKLLIECTSVVDVISKFFCIKTTTEMKYQHGKKETQSMDELKEKKVLLLISDLELWNNDLATIIGIYDDLKKRKENYEILWIPIVEEPSKDATKRYDEQRCQMPWYSLKSIAIISKVTLKVMKEEWCLKQGTTTVVLLNEKGKVENKNAMTLIRVWGCDAFPFTESIGYKLWNQKGFNWFELLVKKAMLISDQLEQNLIFLYGSAEDYQTTEGHGLLEIIKKYCTILDVRTKKELFWIYLESFISSKVQANSNVHDSVTQDLLEVYNNYTQRGGFAILARGYTVIINTSLVAVIKVLSNYQAWCESITKEWTFDKAFKKQHDEPGFIEPPSCRHFSIPSTVGNIPEYISCTKCNRNMDVTVTFKCCHGAH